MIPLDKFVFFDESGVDEHMQNDYALSEKGIRAYGERGNGRKKRIGLIAAIGAKGLKAPFQVEGNVDGEFLEKYFREYLVQELEEGQVVVMDNASYHKRAGIKEAIEEAGCKLLFLPTYSPDFNPIEQVWSQLKGKIKKLKRDTEKTTEEAIEWAINEVSTCSFLGYFENFKKIIHGSI